MLSKKKGYAMKEEKRNIPEDFEFNLPAFSLCC